jgi:hypothetical protein
MHVVDERRKRASWRLGACVGGGARSAESGGEASARGRFGSALDAVMLKTRRSYPLETWIR